MTNFAFTGTRQGLTPEQHKALSDLVLSVLYDIDEVRHGGAQGADSQFHSICVHHGIEDRVHIYPSNLNGARAVLEWLDGAGWTVHPAADPISRNHLIVALSDHLIAAPAGPEKVRSGTWSTIRYARRVRRPVTIVWPDGRQEKIEP